MAWTRAAGSHRFTFRVTYAAHAYHPRNLGIGAVLTTVTALLVACGGAHQGNSHTLPDACKEKVDLEMVLAAITARDWVSGRAHLDAALQIEPQHPRARFLLASIALEEGKLDEAADLARRLKMASPLGEADILGALVEARRRGEQWRAALLRAWRNAGRPDLQQSTLVVEPPTIFEASLSLEAHARASADPHEQVVYALANIGSAWAVTIASAALPMVSDPGIAVAAMDHLRSVPDGQALPSERAALIRDAARGFARRHPDTMQFALIAALVGAARDAPFSATELDEIERASRLPTARTNHFRQVYERAVRVYRTAGLPNAPGFAFFAALWSIATGSDVLLLTKRTEASLPHVSESDKRRLADSLWRIGAAIKEMPTILERLVGTMAMKKGAELAGDVERASEADKIATHGRAVLTEFQKLNEGGWPIPSLQEEMLAAALDNEFAARQEAAEPIPMPEKKRH